MAARATPRFAFFGDSLTDDGNLFRIGEGLIDDAFRIARTGWEGRISDGPTWAEHVAPLLGLGASLNYAIAGAEATGTQSLRDYAVSAGAEEALIVPLDSPDLSFDMNLGAQVDRFAAATGGAGRGAITAFVLIGGNDYGGIDPTDPIRAILALLETMRAATDSTLAAAADLSALGVAATIVASLPSARFLPSLAGLAPALLDAAQELVGMHNGLLRDGVAALRAGGEPVRFLDLTRFTDAIAGDPDQFGILAPWGLTLRDGDPDELARYHADQVGFWDAIHPSAATHGVLGALVAHGGRATVLGGRADHRDSGDGDDLVLANAGGDAIDAGRGDDRVFLGRGDDLARLRAGRDMASGGSGDDTLFGGAGDDVLAGGSGGDRLAGRKGDDVLIDGPGDDILRGGAGDDLFVFVADGLPGAAGAGANRIAGGDGADRLILALGAEAAADFAAAPSQAAGLAALGIVARDIETVAVVAGRAGLEAALGIEAWHAEADLWGLV